MTWKFRIWIPVACVALASVLTGCGGSTKQHRILTHIRRAEATRDYRRKTLHRRQALQLAQSGFVAAPSRDSAYCGYMLAGMFLRGGSGLDKNILKARQTGDKAVKMLKALQGAEGGYAAALRDTHRLLEQINREAGNRAWANRAKTAAARYDRIARSEKGRGFTAK